MVIETPIQVMEQIRMTPEHLKFSEFEKDLENLCIELKP